MAYGTSPPSRAARDTRLGTPGSAHKAQVTRDTASNPSGGGTRGPRRPAGRRHPDATTAGEESWSSGLTGPQRVFPAWDGVPGYEFEGRRTAQRPQPPKPPPPPPPPGGARAPRGPRRAASGTPRPSASRYPPGTTSSHPASSSTPRPRPPAATTATPTTGTPTTHT